MRIVICIEKSSLELVSNLKANAKQLRKATLKTRIVETPHHGETLYPTKLIENKLRSRGKPSTRVSAAMIRREGSMCSLTNTVIRFELRTLLELSEPLNTTTAPCMCDTIA